jgi:thioredoxin 1
MTNVRDHKQTKRRTIVMGDDSPLIHIGDDNFETEVLQSDKPALVDFWAPWCGPCRAIAPVLDELAAQYKGQVKVAKINIDDHQKTASAYGVRSIPTLILFKDGKAQDTIIGLASKDRLEGLLKKIL